MEQEAAKRLGPLLLGGLISLGVSGIVSMQVYIYFRTYKDDYFKLRCVVGVVWMLDLAHAALVCACNWWYLIEKFGNNSVLDYIPMSLALSILVTAMTTFVVQCFFARRVLILSKTNWIVSAPMFLMALIRLVSATATTVLMIRTHSFTEFRIRFGWVFTFGLAASLVLDVLVTLSLCYYLRHSRSGFGDHSMDYVLDTILLYTINNGSFTCITTVVSLIFWLVMPSNLVYMGFHFIISKLYANSFLATLNTRDTLRERSQRSSERGHPLPILFSSRANTSHRVATMNDIVGTSTTGTVLQVNVEKTIHCEVEEETEDAMRSNIH